MLIMGLHISHYHSHLMHIQLCRFGQQVTLSDTPRKTITLVPNNYIVLHHYLSILDIIPHAPMHVDEMQYHP